ncbi:hypothetical protein Egran_05619 [Elaphomyces granulatus]|uniref:Uncharacterized protein n=1 Tax=Elaphomyces granulatus TaxID=519963 RepID=A0A232LR30_9EURO|nr:hypothetical protein Egran_05619 [Elaphomyces granulatus]
MRGEIKYREALRRVFRVKEAVATAHPYFVAVLSYGNAFIYNQGFLCYIYADEIRVLNVHYAGKMEQVLNIRTILRRVIPGFVADEASALVEVTLVHYSDGILAILVRIEESGTQAWLVALDVTEKRKYGRVRLRRQLSSTRRLFVRHNQQYLYYGTHSALGSHGHDQWAIQCVDLSNGRNLTSNPLILEDFAGSDIGQTVCFEIYQGQLYAVTNQVNFDEDEEMDWNWVSFYVWTCLSPTSDLEQPRLKRIWRRQHLEGPINDTWTDISLRKDESTGRLLILECRREWKGGKSDNFRTYYIQPLPLPSEETGEGEAGDVEGLPSTAPILSSSASGLRQPLLVLLPPNDPLTMTLDETEPPKKRICRYVHPEYGWEDEASQRRDFILAKTKYRTYNLSASAFVDLVIDPQQSSPVVAIPRDRLRIRISSRKRKNPIDEKGEEATEKGLLFPPLLESGKPIEWSEERFASRGTSLWPPDGAPQELVDLLCPWKKAAEVQAAADERTLIYSVSNAEEGQAIILISFDPEIKLPGLKLLQTSKTEAQETKVAVDAERPRARDERGKSRAILLGAPSPQSSAIQSLRTEQALHMGINHGFWLRRQIDK